MFFHSFDEYATTGIFNEYTESVDWKAANFGSRTNKYHLLYPNSGSSNLDWLTGCHYAKVVLKTISISGIFYWKDATFEYESERTSSPRYHPCTHPQTSDICLIGGHHVTNTTSIMRFATAKGIFALENNGYFTELIPNVGTVIGSPYRTLSSMGLRQSNRICRWRSISATRHKWPISSRVWIIF